MKFNPYKYQVNAAEFMVDNPRAFLYLDLGLGKTVITLSVIKHLKQKEKIKGALVITPIRPMYKTWPAEIQKWDHLRSLTYTILHGSDKLKQLKAKPRPDIYLINYEGIKWLTCLLISIKDTSKIPFDLIVFDESSAFKSNSSKRFRWTKQIINLFDYRYGLTGTPAPNSLLDIWPQFLLIDDGKRLGISYTFYRDRFFAQIDYHGYKYRLKYDAKKQISNLCQDIVLRMKAEDYLDMPEKINRTIECIMPDNLMKQYRKLEKAFFLQIENEEVTAFNTATLSGKLRQFISGGIYTEHPQWKEIHRIKTEELKNIRSIYDEPTLVAIQFKFEYDLICQTFDMPNLPVLYGDTPNKVSNDLIDQWNSGHLDMLIVHPQSVAHGINLQSGGRMIFWLSLPWSYEQYVQLNGRLYRQGQTKSVIIHHILMENTIDIRVYRVLREKHSNQTSFLKTLIEGVKNV